MVERAGMPPVSRPRCAPRTRTCRAARRRGRMLCCSPTRVTADTDPFSHEDVRDGRSRRTRPRNRESIPASARKRQAPGARGRSIRGGVAYPKTRSILAFGEDGTARRFGPDDTPVADRLPGFSCPVAALFEEARDGARRQQGTVRVHGLCRASWSLSMGWLLHAPVARRANPRATGACPRAACPSEGWDTGTPGGRHASTR